MIRMSVRISAVHRLRYTLRTYGIRNNLRPRLETLIEALYGHSAHATFFVTIKWLEKNQWLIPYLERFGHGIEPHGYRHKYYYNDPDITLAYSDIKQATQRYRELVGRKPRGFRAPYTGCSERPPEWYSALYAAGIEFDSSVWGPGKAPFIVPIRGLQGIAGPAGITQIPIHETDNNIAGNIAPHRIAEYWLAELEAARLAGRPLHLDLHPIRVHWYREALNRLLDAAGSARPLGVKPPQAHCLLLSCDIDQATLWDYATR